MKTPKRQATRQATAGFIDMQLSMPRERRRALKAALTEAVAGQGGGPWRIRVSTKLVYVTPRTGVPLIKLTLLSSTGETLVALVDPDKLTPESIARAIDRARHLPAVDA